MAPIAENQNAHIAHLYNDPAKLPPVTRTGINTSASTLTELSQIDNGIMFLDNGEKLIQPKGMPTPPPPMWGAVLEEEKYDKSAPFYDHEKSMAEMKMRKTQAQLKHDFEHGKNHDFDQNTDKPISKRLKLKKKVIYTYEYEDKSDHEEDRKISQRVQLPSARGPQIHIADQ